MLKFRYFSIAKDDTGEWTWYFRFVCREKYLPDNIHHLTCHPFHIELPPKWSADLVEDLLETVKNTSKVDFDVDDDVRMSGDDINKLTRSELKELKELCILINAKKAKASGTFFVWLWIFILGIKLSLTVTVTLTLLLSQKWYGLNGSRDHVRKVLFFILGTNVLKNWKSMWREFGLGQVNFAPQKDWRFASQLASWAWAKRFVPTYYSHKKHT